MSDSPDNPPAGSAAETDTPEARSGQTGSGQPPDFASIIIQGGALQRIQAELAADTSAEIGGVLVGNAAPSTNFVLVTGSLPASRPLPTPGFEAVEALEADGVGDAGESAVGDAGGDDSGSDFSTAPVTFSLSAEVLEDLARQVATVYPGQRIVGWYHSHPGAGVFLAAHDVYIHTAFFAQPWQVNYVYDPVRHDGGFFGWSGRDLVRIPQWEVTSMSVATGAGLPVNEPALAAPAAAGGLAPTAGVARTSASGESPIGAGTSSLAASTAPRRRFSMAAIVGAVVVLLAVIIGLVVLLGGGDDKASGPTSPVNTVDNDAGNNQTTSSATTVPDQGSPMSSTSTSEPVVPQTNPPTNTETVVTDPPVLAFPATPTNVATPAARVGGDVAACTAGSDGSFTPTSNCFVPLNNGNVLVFNGGRLRCVDPSAAADLATDVESFTVGVVDDPLPLVADGDLTPTCIDLSYVRQILANGAQTLDGLCGSSGTQINDGTRRCFAHNATSGAVVAIVRGATDSTALEQSCTDGGDPVRAEIAWSSEVSTAWRLDSVVYRSATNDFVATASRRGVTATATLTCG
ncbi:MAG TPA: hypothetical protein PLV68_03825 [Ilumatobacteraceae bacterium]|nr:hypothetical protein [Ilumatobacteraceae bacterium]